MRNILKNFLKNFLNNFLRKFLKINEKILQVSGKTLEELIKINLEKSSGKIL